MENYKSSGNFNVLDYTNIGYFVIDYNFNVIFWNKMMETFTGIGKENITDKKIYEFFPAFLETKYKYILNSVFEDSLPVILSGKEHKNLLANKKKQINTIFNIKVSSLPIDDERFYAIFSVEDRKEVYNKIDELYEINKKQKILAEATKNLNNVSVNNINYHGFCEKIQELTDSQYVAFNKFDENGKDFTTLAISGINENITKASKILGFNIVGKKWKHDPHREKLIKKNKTTVFNKLSDLTQGSLIKKNIITIIEKTFYTGNVVIIKILKDNIIIGDFTIIFKKNHAIKNLSLAETFADAVGQTIDRIKSEKELKANQEELEGFFNVNLDLLCIADLEGNFIKTNKAWGEILGYSTAELNKWKFLEFVHPDDMQATLDAMATLGRGDEVLSFTNRYISKDGSYRYIEWRSYPKDNLIYAAARDITDRILKEQEILSQKQQIEKFFNQSLYGFFMCMLDEPIEWNENTDKDKMLEYILVHQRMTRANQAMLDQYGAAEEEFIGITVRELFKQDLDHAREIWRGLFDKGKWHMEFRDRKMDGTPIIIEGDYTCIYDEEGRITGHFGVQVDITEQKQAKEKLRQSEERLNTLLSNTPAVIYSYKFEDGIPRVTYVNKNVKKVLGFEPEYFIDNFENFRECVHPDDAGRLFAAMPELLGKGSVSLGEYRFKDWHGKYHWLLDEQKLITGEDGSQEVVGAWWDITERKRAEQALLESEDKYRSLVENLNEIIYTLNEKAEITYVSPNIETLSGYALSQVLGKQFTDFVHSDYVQECIESFKKAISGKNEASEYRFATKNGEVVWVRTAARPIIKQGQAVGVQGTLIDITEQKRAEEALKISEQNKKILLDNIQTQIWYLTDETTYGTLNQAHADFQGAKIEDIAFKNLYDIFPEEVAEVCRQSNTKVFSTKKTVRSEEWVPNASGEKRLLSITKTPKPKDDGSVEYVVCSAEDITEQKNAELELKENRQLLQSVLESQKEMICRFKPDTTLTFVNKSYCKYFGKTERELTGKKFLELVPKEAHKNILNHIESFIKSNKESLAYEHEALDKDGAIKWQQWTDTKIKDVNGNIVELQSVGTDITDRVKKEKLEKEVEVAKQNLSFKQKFLSSISHEMRTPLTAIIGASKIIEKHITKNEQKELIRDIINSSENLEILIDQILDYSNIETGKAELKKTTFKTNELKEIASNTFKKFCNKPIKFSYKIDKAIPKILIADKNRINQIINKLIFNAVKFTEKGEVTFAISKNSEIINNKISIKINIADTGIGLSSEKQKEIFTPFTQVNLIDTEKYEGLGLGLAICKKLAELHDGEIGVDSTKGKGSNFWFTFTADIVQKKQTADDKQPPTTKKDKEKIRVLFVEDKDVTRKIVSLLLQKSGYEVSLANNGKEAIDMFKPEDFDIVIMDIQMPVMDGVTATKKLIEKYGEKMPPIVGLSANIFEGAREKYMKEGMSEFLTKPLNMEEFDEVVENLLGSAHKITKSKKR